MKIGIVDDHSIVIEGYQRLLETQNIEIAFTATSLQSATQCLAEYDIDGLILDISLPDGNGIEFLANVVTTHPFCKILIASMYNKEPFISRALAAGASGFITKSEAADELIDALSAINEGMQYIGSCVEYNDNEDVKNSLSQLTNREMSLLQALAVGKSIKTIARELDIMPKTAHAHRSNLLRKLGVRENAELLKIAVSAQLVDPNAL